MHGIGTNHFTKVRRPRLFVRTGADNPGHGLTLAPYVYVRLVVVFGPRRSGARRAPNHDAARASGAWTTLVGVAWRYPVRWLGASVMSEASCLGTPAIVLPILTPRAAQRGRYPPRRPSARRGTVQASIELDVFPAAQSAHPPSRRSRRDRIHRGTIVGSITIKHHGKAAAAQARTERSVIQESARVRRESPRSPIVCP